MKIKIFYKDSLIKNSIYQMVTNFSSVGVGFFFWVIAARYYTPKEVGIISAVISSMLLISMIGSIGFPTALIYYLPKFSEKRNGIINSCMIISTVVSITFSMIFILGLKIWSPELKTVLGNFDYTLTFIIVSTTTTISSLMSGVFMAQRRSSFHMIKENIFGIIKIFPLIFLVGFSAMGIFLSWGFGLIIAMVFGFFLLNKTWKYNFVFEINPIISKMAHFSIGNYFSDLFYTLPKLVLPVMIVNLTSPENAGYFFIAMTVAGILYGVSQSTGNSLLAETSNGEGMMKNINKAIIFDLFLVVMGIIFFTLFGKYILNIFNKNYGDNATPILIILSIAGIPMTIIYIFNTVRNIQNRVSSLIKTNMSVAIITLVLSFPFLKLFGIKGAAMAYLIATSITAIVVMSRINNLSVLASNLLDNVNIYFKKIKNINKIND